MFRTQLFSRKKYFYYLSCLLASSMLCFASIPRVQAAAGSKAELSKSSPYVPTTEETENTVQNDGSSSDLENNDQVMSDSKNESNPVSSSNSESSHGSSAASEPSSSSVSSGSSSGSSSSSISSTSSDSSSDSSTSSGSKSSASESSKKGSDGVQNTPSSSADTATEQSTNARASRQTQKSASSRTGNTASLDAQNKEFRRITNTYSKAQVLAAGNKARNNSSDNDNNEGKRNTDNNIVDFTNGATAYAPPTSAVLKDDSHFTLNSFLYFGAVFLIILAFTIYGEIQDSRKYKIEDYDWKEKKKNK